MTIAQELRFRFDDLLAETSAPAADAIDALAELVRNHAVEEYLGSMKGNSEDNRRQLLSIQQYYDEHPDESEAAWLKLASSLRAEYVATARRKLDSITKLALVGTVERSQAEQMNLQADTKNQLLQLSIAEDFISRLGAATRRSEKLLDWSVERPSSEEADRYLSEACNCFIYGFFTSCAVMCRSLLEEVLERKMPGSMLRLIEPKGRTLGNLLHAINNDLPGSGLDAGVPLLLRLVNEKGSFAAHSQAMNEDDALSCLQKSRAAIVLMLS